MIGRFLMAALLSATLTVSPPTDTGAPEVPGAGGGGDQQQSQEVTDNADDGWMASSLLLLWLFAGSALII